MTIPSEHSTLFEGPPRRRGLAAVPVVALWLVLSVGFALEVTPVRPAEVRMSELEARRAEYARAAAQRRTPVVAREGERPIVAGRPGRPAVQARTPAPHATPQAGFTPPAAERCGGLR